MRADRVIPIRLKQARQRAGISQEKLGVAAGIDEMSASARMNQYERGVHIPGPQTLARIADALAIPAPYFYATDDEIAEAILLFGALTKEGRRKALAALRQGDRGRAESFTTEIAARSQKKTARPK